MIDFASHSRDGEVMKFQVFWYVTTCRLVNSYVLEQRAIFVYGVCPFKIQRFVTKIFVVVVNVINVIILRVLYINFIVAISGQVFFPVFCLVG